MSPRIHRTVAALVALIGCTIVLAMSCTTTTTTTSDSRPSRDESNPRDADHEKSAQGGHQSATDLVAEGRETFRHDTFGSEDFWGGQLRLHDAVQGEKLGGVGAGVGPNQALKLGLKVDSEAVPKALADVIKKGGAPLDDPASTVALLKANAVVGLTGFFSSDGKRLTSLGIQCALCHSTVDDSFAPGIGKRLDGWPNRDLDIGKIVSVAPNLKPLTDMLQVDEATVKKVLTSWGPGKFDAQLNLDGKGFRPDGKPAATLNPPAFGLAGVNQHTWTGSWGTVSYWNAYVANLEMHGKGNFFDPRLDDSSKYPVAARTKQGHKHDAEDRITPKLAGLHVYQLSLPTPRPPTGAFDSASAERGRVVFNTTANCASCHVPPLFTEPGWNLHTAEEIGIDDFQSSRAPDGRYRTVPLRALWSSDKVHKGGFYHDGRFATLEDVVEHYDNVLKLGLDQKQKRDLIEYLKSL
jgi:hypothetical protein